MRVLRRSSWALLLALVPLASAQTPAATPTPITCDVAIIGGGAAGASTAVFLKDKGYKVCLLEKTAALGGHCLTQQVSGAPANSPDWVELGTHLFGNTTYFNKVGFGSWRLSSEQHLSRFLPPSSLISVDYAQRPEELGAADLNQRDPVRALNPRLTLDQQRAIDDAYFTLFIIASQYPWLDDAANFPDPLPSELLVPFDEFLSDQPDLQPLVETLLTPSLGNAGLGSFSKLTTLYALLALRRGILSLTKDTDSGIKVKGGCSAFYSGIRSFLGDAAYLSTTITAITRPDAASNTTDAPTAIDATTGPNGSAARFLASQVIVAVPQTLAGLQVLGLDEKETAAFADVRTRAYFTGPVAVAGGRLPMATNGFRLRNLNSSNSPASVPQAATSVIELSRNLSYGPAVVYAYSDIADKGAAAEVVVKSQLSKVPDTLITSATLTRLQAHVYQPYFTAEALARSPSPYTVLKQLQGYRNTYYVGALLSFAESIKVWEHSFRLVDTFFPTKATPSARRARRAV